ncbi:MAG: ATP-dependent DNA helicase RecG, partial [Phycisphaerae bacterium]|nr:ATP-dependent DNA helicase RecG [Phycisphaerae bacterium]
MSRQDATPPVTGEEPSPLSLGTLIQDAPDVGPRRARLLGRLGIHTVADAIKHLPHRYEYQAGRTTIGQLPEGAVATAAGLVAKSRWIPASGFRRGRRGRLTATIEDDSGELDMVFFNAAYLRDRVRPGVQVQVTGKVQRYQGRRQMANPRLHVLAAAGDDTAPASARDEAERYRPVYPATEAINTVQLERLIADLLPATLPQVEDHLTADYRRERGLPELREAYRVLHDPDDEEAVRAARRRLAYDELLLLQLGFSLKRQHRQTQLSAPALRWSEAIDQHIRDRFPFPLTASQDQVVADIHRDLVRDRPMNRLLQGDVGSGKTVVALYALLMATASQMQGVLMAPTELLAEQHFLSITQMLEGSNVRIALLTGSLTRGERDAVLYRIERGEIDIVIGTHALLTETVQFNQLALVIVDEQHRFGVVQRAALRSKAAEAATVPHTLVMTATPIPRTLSLTIFGDLDVSTITHLPPGRQPIDTRVVEPEKSDEVYAHVAQRLAAGEQAYVVLPAIDDGDLGLKAVRSHAAMLEQSHFADLRLATLHGQLRQQTRQRLMQRFRDRGFDALVATTVIEVGVDVPNASIMVIEHAERFGLAQLHQLRGRVGRGTRKSLCVMIAEPVTESAQQRMAAIAGTTDGFAIAEADLKIRGMGELLGTRQAGLPPLKVADLSVH